MTVRISPLPFGRGVRGEGETVKRKERVIGAPSNPLPNSLPKEREKETKIM